MERPRNRRAEVRPLRAGALLALLLAAVPGVAPGAEAFAQTGAISGTVRLEQRAQRRSANRYAGAGTAAARVQMLPVIVYLVGSVPGSSVSSPVS